MFLVDQFWAPRGVYKKCGMFTYEHIILLAIFISILILLVYTSKYIKREQVKKITRILAIILTILEGIKIYFNYYWGYTSIGTWLPISYCSIFIYALWLSGYGKKIWKELGDAFIAGGAIIGGGAFLLFPSTSLMMYPAGHYLSLYSMMFHTLMMYVGIMYIFKLEIKLDIKRYKKYVIIYLFFAIIAIILNITFGSNLMLLKKPFKIPVPFLHRLYDAMPWSYTILIFIIYLIVPYYIAVFISKFRKDNNIN